MADFNTEADRPLLRVLEFFRVRDRGASGGLSKQWMDRLHADPALTSAVLTVDLVLGQDTHVRIAAAPLEVLSSLSGQRIAYLPQLVQEPALGRAYRLGDPAAQVESVSVQIDGRLIKASEILAAGRMLAGHGEICLQIPEGLYEDRMVLLRGEMTGGVTFGGDQDLIEVEIADPKITCDLTIPPWICSDSRHPGLPQEWVGERYPLVFNGFRKVQAIRLSAASGWPTAVWPSWLACYGHEMTVDAVFVNGNQKASGSADYPWAEVDAFDDLGVAYKEVAFSSSATTWADSDSVSVSLTTSGESLHLIEILGRLVEQYSILGSRGAHQPLFARARGLLPDLRPSVLINASNANDEAGVLSFIEGTLLLSFPMVSMVWQHGRYGPIVTDYRARRPAADLEAGAYPMIARVSDVQEIDKEEIYNVFVLRYGWDAMSETFSGVATRDPSNDAACRLSRDLAGQRTYDVLESVFIQRSAEAEYVLDWLVAHLANPSYYVEWLVFPWVLLTLSRGDPVWISDPELGWSAERAVVQSIARSESGEITMGLRVWPGRKRLHSAR